MFIQFSPGVIKKIKETIIVLLPGRNVFVSQDGYGGIQVEISDARQIKRNYAIFPSLPEDLSVIIHELINKIKQEDEIQSKIQLNKEMAFITKTEIDDIRKALSWYRSILTARGIIGYCGFEEVNAYLAIENVEKRFE